MVKQVLYISLPVSTLTRDRQVTVPPRLPSWIFGHSGKVTRKVRKVEERGRESGQRMGGIGPH